MHKSMSFSLKGIFVNIKKVYDTKVPSSLYLGPTLTKGELTSEGENI